MSFLRISSTTNRYMIGGPQRAPNVFVGVDLQVLERLGDQPHFPIPRIVGMIHGQVQLEVLAVAPHLELVRNMTSEGFFEP